MKFVLLKLIHLKGTTFLRRVTFVINLQITELRRGSGSERGIAHSGSAGDGRGSTPVMQGVTLFPENHTADLYHLLLIKRQIIETIKGFYICGLCKSKNKKKKAYKFTTKNTKALERTWLFWDS